MRTHNDNSGGVILNLCGCGRLHFSYGPITIHLAREEFLILAERIAQAAGFLKESVARSEPGFQTGSPSSTCH